MTESRRFGLGEADTDRMVEAVRHAVEGGGIELDERALRVSIGVPPIFDLEIPRRSIRRVRRRPDGSVSSRGVHGAFGKWAVVRSGTGLVELEIAPPARASLRLSRSVEGVRMPGSLRWLMRDRKVRVRRLTISVDDPQGLIDALT